LTLTIPTTESPYDALSILYKSFKRLRQRKWWQSRVQGGFSGAEITRSGKLFHVHVHCIVFSRYLPQHELAGIWKSVSPGRIVDIRLLPETTAISYICKYITKQAIPDADREMCARALQSRRLYSTFGHAHRMKIVVKFSPFPCKNCGAADWTLLSLLCCGKGYEIDSLVDT
jgi:hypothetical protein